MEKVWKKIFSLKSHLQTFPISKRRLSTRKPFHRTELSISFYRTFLPGFARFCLFFFALIWHHIGFILFLHNTSSNWIARCWLMMLCVSIAITYWGRIRKWTWRRWNEKLMNFYCFRFYFLFCVQKDKRKK